ncbi:3-hydroxyacyl-CoA dehydrogenase [Rhizobium sp. SLBN-94]|jgi:3-hydroxyacyl-CoA dehydrogenase|nr:3-hydroxyacyl-CoA dehydrogenase [Rhizobium sp. SLBN-94]
MTNAATSRIDATAETVVPTASVTSGAIEKAAVIGAGSMGSGIAAQLANAGIPVVLLDIASLTGERNALATSGIEKQLKTGGFMHPARAALIETGNIEDDLHRIADADWIVEAIVEDLDLKRALYRRIEAVRRDGSVISSNTSTLPLNQLTEGLGERFAGDFVITHFFNPPRIMPLLELVGGERTRAAALEKARLIGDVVMGKTIVACRDTPGFIANRIGNYWMSVASLEAMRLGLTVEEADAVMGKPFGIPRTGIFGLFDYVGIQLVPLVWGSFMRILSADDAHRAHDITKDSFFVSMLDRGLIGRFGPGGFYRRRFPTGERIDEVIDLVTGDYRSRQEPDLASLRDASHLRQLCEHVDKGGRYAWSVLSKTVAYTASIAPDIADDVLSIDKAMRLGYNWRHGPFELADSVGVAWLAGQFVAEGIEVPPLLKAAVEAGGFYPKSGQYLNSDGSIETSRDAKGTLTVASIRRNSQPVDSNASASVWDVGNGVACLEIHTKMNACDIGVISLVEKLPDLIGGDFQSLIIGSDNARAFSAGAQLDTFIDHVTAQDWAGLTNFIRRGQNAWLALKYAPFPVVAAAGGLALGGGCELMMHADEIVAHSELLAGLPERKVGILPGWGGVTQLLVRQQKLADMKNAAEKTFAVIAGGDVSGSALLARDAGFLRSADTIVMNRESLLSAAAARAADLANNYQARAREQITVGGPAQRAQLLSTLSVQAWSRTFTATDQRIVAKLAWVISGGAEQGVISEEGMMTLELEAIVDLAREPETLARLQHMRSTNKPLLN